MRAVLMVCIWMLWASTATATTFKDIVADFQSGRPVHIAVLGNSIGQGAHAVEPLTPEEEEQEMSMADKWSQLVPSQFTINNDPSFHCWVNLLRNYLVAANPNSTVYNRSFSGWKVSDHLTSGSVGIVAAQTPTVQMVLIPLLVNDWCYPGNPTAWATFQAQYRQLVQQVIDAGMVPVLVKETDLDPEGYNRTDGRYYPTFIAEVDVVAAEFGGLGVIDMYTPLHDFIVASGGVYKASGVMSEIDPSFSVHPNIAGHNMAFQSAQTFLNQVIPPPRKRTATVKIGG